MGAAILESHLESLFVTVFQTQFNTKEDTSFNVRLEWSLVRVFVENKARLLARLYQEVGIRRFGNCKENTKRIRSLS